VTTLHLGELDQPYAYDNNGQTTGDVAEALEQRYGLFSAFVNMNEDAISQQVENSLEGAFETMFMTGQFSRLGAFNTATSGIEDLFRTAIDMRAYDGRLKGVPTRAAQMGVRHSKKNPFGRWRGRGKNKHFEPWPPRASFFDTGLLSSSFRAWVD